MKRWIAPTYLFACLVLGGSGQGIWPNMVLQLAGIAILWIAVRNRQRRTRSVKQLTWLVVALLVLLIVQLLPLPAAIWHGLPGRAEIVEADRLMGLNAPWRAISLSPWDTLGSALALIPPLAMFFAVAKLEGRSIWKLGLAVAAALIIGLLLGVLQHGSTQWYLYPVSNVGVATGLFANGNHMAAFLLCVLPLAAAAVEAALTTRERGQARWAMVTAAAAIGVAALVGLAVNGSLFGWAMLVPVSLASLVIAFRHRIGRPLKMALAGVALIGAVSAVGMMMVRPATSTQVSLSTRQEMATTSVELLTKYFPIGSGVGSFAKVYPTVEKPADVTFVYVNHAHDDYLEWLVEAGLAGGIVLALFLAWWGRQAIGMVRDRRSDGAALAGAVIGLILLIHSAIDFPLRTSALSALFAMATGLMLVSRRLPKQRKDFRPARHMVIE